MSSTSAVPYTCTQGPSKSSERMQMLTWGSRRVLLVLARCGYVDTTMRPSGSTPQLTGESCGVDPEGRIVVSTYPQRAKTSNTRRDPQVSICILSADFHGPWVQVDGTGE